MLAFLFFFKKSIENAFIFEKFKKTRRDTIFRALYKIIK